jgi:hypothetical protein
MKHPPFADIMLLPVMGLSVRTNVKCLLTPLTTSELNVVLTLQ